jgi:O-antigen/teichoic acid export membrane protein
MILIERVVSLLSKVKGNTRKGNVFIYIFGEVLSKISPFLLVPIIARLIGPKELAIYSNFTVGVFIIQMLLSGWAVSYVSVYYFKSINKYRKSILITLCFSCFFAFLSLILLLISLLLFKSEILVIVSLVTLSASASSISSLYLAIKQIKKQANEFVVFSIIKSVFMFALVIAALYSLEDVVAVDLIFVVTLVHCIFAVLVTKAILANSGVTLNSAFKKKQIVHMLSFGLPIIPGALLNSVRTTIDRFLLYFYFGSAIVGTYSAAYQLCTVVLVLSASMIRAYAPEIFQALEKQNIKRLHYLFKQFIVPIIIIALCTNILIYFFGSKLLGQSFANIQEFSFISLLFIFQSATSFISGFYQFNNKTTQLMNVNLIGFLFYFVVCWVGAIFSLWAFVLAMLIGSFMSLWINYWFGIRNVNKNTK